MPRGIYNRKRKGKRKYTKRVKENVFPLPEQVVYFMSQQSYDELKDLLVQLDERLSSLGRVPL
jgi:hypothetical protein